MSTCRSRTTSRAAWTALVLVSSSLVIGCHGEDELASCPQPSHAAPSSFGEGFVDLTGDIEASLPFELDPVDDKTHTEPELSVGAIADLDGDGQPEVVLSQAGYDPNERPGIYRYDPAAKKLTPATSIPMLQSLQVMAAIDLDGDGVTDILSGARIAWGLGKGDFEMASPLDPAAGPVFFSGQPTPYLDDIDGDGWLDILIGIPCCGGTDGTCRALRPMLRTGLRAFTDRTDLVPETIAGKPYAVISTEVGAGERVLAQLGWSCVNPEKAQVFYRQKGTGADGYPAYEAFDPAPAGSYFHESHGGKQVSMSAFSPMGAAAGDLDGDGMVDIGVMLNPDHALLRGTAKLPLEDRTRCSGFPTLSPDQGKNPMLPWGAAFVDLDRDGRLDAVFAHGNDTGGWFDPSHFTGPQYSTAHWNAGDIVFTDVTEQLGIGRRGQWRSVTVGDLDGDGDADLIIGGQGEPPRIYQNRIDTGNHGLALRLHGTTSNHLGIGARVEVPEAGGVPAQHLVMGGVGSPLVVSEALVFVALGTATTAGPFTIRWPSGLEQTVSGLAAGKVHDVTEPALVEISPPGRHVPVGDPAGATIRVTPRGSDGAPREAKVTLKITSGQGAVAAPTRDGASWVFAVTPPPAKGSSVVEASIDGTPVKVRPRLWWDG